MNISAYEIAAAAGGKVISGNPGACACGISTDSNKIKNGDLFVPVIGRRVDGHSFLKSAFDNGAAASLSGRMPDDETLMEAGGRPVILVKDTVKALQAFAEYYRKTYVRIPYVGVTGSVGKTTTREMTALALSASFKTYATKGNANSQVGVPITVAETPAGAGAGVIEMGISEPGEMERLSRIVRSEAAIITNIGISHIENLKTRENIMREKLGIIKYMPEGGMLLLDGDDALLSAVTGEVLKEIGAAGGNIPGIRYYGTGENAYYRAENIRMEEEGIGYSLFIGGKYACVVRLNVEGRHMVLNSLAALSAADVLGADVRLAAQRLTGFKNPEGRGSRHTAGGISIINDAYNSAPQSAKAGLSVLNNSKTPEGGRRIAVLSDMLELGEEAGKSHRELGEFTAKGLRNIDLVLTYGRLSKGIRDGFLLAGGKEEACRHFESYESLFGYLKGELKKGDTVLFKGSNSMELWKMAAELEKELSGT